MIFQLNFNSIEKSTFLEVTRECYIDKYIGDIVEQYIYDEVIEVYANGDLKAKYKTKYGLKDGLYQSWFENKNKWIECTYKNDKKHGLRQQWYKNGTLLEMCTYIEGKRHGTYLAWHRNGNRWIECTYKNDKKHGLNTTWLYNGDKWVESYNNNKKITKSIQII